MNTERQHSRSGIGRPLSHHRAARPAPCSRITAAVLHASASPRCRLADSHGRALRVHREHVARGSSISQRRIDDVLAMSRPHKENATSPRHPAQASPSTSRYAYGRWPPKPKCEKERSVEHQTFDGDAPAVRGLQRPRLLWEGSNGLWLVNKIVSHGVVRPRHATLCRAARERLETTHGHAALRRSHLHGVHFS